MKLGKQVSRMRNRVLGITRLKKLGSPITPSISPKTVSHFGSSFIMSAGMETPAISKPMGTENPTTPTANTM